MKPRDPNAKLEARCNASKCGATSSGTRAELEAAQWLPCARKNGKLEWMCPKCNWALKSDSTAAVTFNTGMMVKPE